jgi:hypothetical protein
MAATSPSEIELIELDYSTMLFNLFDAESTGAEESAGSPASKIVIDGI